MSDHLPNGLGMTTAPYPPAMNMIPYTWPNNAYIPSIGATSSAEDNVSMMPYVVTLLVGILGGGFAVYKAYPYIDAMQKVGRDDGF